jgi:hypothetical protein
LASLNTGTTIDSPAADADCVAEAADLVGFAGIFMDLSLGFGAIYTAWDATCRARLKML